MIEISDEYMIATVGGEVAATARWSWHAAADSKARGSSPRVGGR
jgi:hypothetical protein